MAMFNNPYISQTGGYVYPQSSGNNWSGNQMPTSSFAWIQGGKATANAYPVAPGNTVYLIDSELPVMFKKAADQTGRLLPMETVYLVSEEEYNKLHSETNNQNDSYITRQEFTDFANEMREKYVIRKEYRDGKSSV